MATTISYTELAQRAEISPSYAHQIMNGKRKPPLPVALVIYDATGLQFGGLHGLTKREIEAARKIAA
jgi:transcriptional regulator with XRE-family HTH domain